MRKSVLAADVPTSLLGHERVGVVTSFPLIRTLHHYEFRRTFPGPARELLAGDAALQVIKQFLSDEGVECVTVGMFDVVLTLCGSGVQRRHVLESQLHLALRSLARDAVPTH